MGTKVNFNSFKFANWIKKNSGDYGTYDPQQQQPPLNNGSFYKNSEAPYVLQNPAYSLSVKGQLQQNPALLEKQLKGQQQQVVHRDYLKIPTIRLASF